MATKSVAAPSPMASVAAPTPMAPLDLRNIIGRGRGIADNGTVDRQGRRARRPGEPNARRN